MTRSLPELKKRAAAVLEALEKAHPDARLFLEFDSPLQLLVVTILAAQCRDETINAIRPVLFGRFPDAAALAAAPDEELERIIKASGFFRQKARSVKAACARLVERHAGKVPDDLDALLELPGVGRKTANIVLGNAFGRQAIGVDTHVQRVARRLGLVDQDDPDKIEQQLCRIIEKPAWTRSTLLFGTHGRRICIARKPRCAECPVSRWCDYVKEHPPEAS